MFIYEIKKKWCLSLFLFCFTEKYARQEEGSRRSRSEENVRQEKAEPFSDWSDEDKNEDVTRQVQ